MGDDILRVPPQTAKRSHVFNNYVVSVRRRDALKQFLAERGIQTEVYYPYRCICRPALPLSVTSQGLSRKRSAPPVKSWPCRSIPS